MQGATEKYKTAKAFRIAIADRLKKLSRETGEPYLDLYRRIAIDRFLARLEWSKWLAKGGYILQRRLPKARRTKDLDISATDSGFRNEDPALQEQSLLETFQEAGRSDIGDYFQFQVKLEKALTAFGKGGIRCQVLCLIDGQQWSSFQLDAIVQDETVFPAEDLTGDTFLSFAGFSPLTLKVPPKEEVFAEKIHAYTTPRETENSRVKDMLDMALLIADGLDRQKTSIAISGVFDIRKTHRAPQDLPAPPDNWNSVFAELVTDTGIDLTLEKAFSSVSVFYSQLVLPGNEL